MTNNPNYYQILHLQPDAPAPMIRTAYRTIMQKLKAHPDLGGDADQAALINEAYEVLANPKSRAAYDRKLSEQSAQTQKSQKSKPKPDQHSDSTQSSAQRSASQSTNGSNNSDRHASQFNTTRGNTHFCLFCNASIGYAEQEVCSVCESPLGSIRDADTQVAGHDNRRGIFRMPRTGPVSFCSQSEFLALNSHGDFLKRRAGKMRFGSAQDISPTGMRMRCSETLAASDILRVENNSLIAVAIIANHQQEGPRENSYGLKFISLQLKQARGGFVSTAV